MTVIKRIVVLEQHIPPARLSGPPPDLGRLAPAERLEADAVLANVRPGGDLTGLTDYDLHRLKTLWVMAGAR